MTVTTDRIEKAAAVEPTGGDAAASTAADPIVELRGVYQAYGESLVLRNVDLDVRPHEVVALIGPSGCGKSTLLRTVNLLETLVAGEIRLNGTVVSGSKTDQNAVRQQVGMVFQQFNLFPHLTVLDNITLAPRRVGRVKKAVAERDALALLTRFGLGDKANEYPDRLSGGQQQRVAIIRSLATGPAVVLLDEVTSALDPETVGEVLSLIRELKELGLTLILATHEMSFARQVADRIVFMHAGEIVEQGTPEQILDYPSQPRTRQFVDQILRPERTESTARAERAESTVREAPLDAEPQREPQPQNQVEPEETP